MEEKQEYSMKEAVTLTGLTEHTIRKWVQEFNIQLDTSEGGHRRFSTKSIEILKIARKKKDEQGWSIKQIRSFLNGDLTTEMFEDQDIKSNFEKRLESMEETMRTLAEANKYLAEKLDETTRNTQIAVQNALQSQEERILNVLNQSQKLIETDKTSTIEETNKNLDEKLDENNRNIELTLQKVLKEQEENIINVMNEKLSNETEKRDRVLMQELRKTQEEIAASNSKKWYQFWK